VIAETTHRARLRLASDLRRCPLGLTIAEVEGMPWAQVLPWS